MRRGHALVVLIAAIAGFAVYGAAATLGVSSARLDTFDSAAPAETTTTAGDTTEPTPTGADYLDVNPVDGKIDRVVVTYSEALGPFTGAPSDWTLNNSRPAGMNASPNTVSVATNTVTLDWTTGFSTGANTGPTGVTISLGNANAVQDLAGNFALASTTNVTDKAGPVPVSLSVTANSGGGSTPRGINGDDRVDITFSEHLQVSTVCSTWTSGGVNANTTNQETMAPNDAIRARITDGTPRDAVIVEDGIAAGVACPTLQFGTIGVDPRYHTNNTTFSGNGSNATGIRWTATSKVLTLEFGTPSVTPVPQLAVSPSPPVQTVTYTVAAGMTDAANNPAVNQSPVVSGASNF